MITYKSEEWKPQQRGSNSKKLKIQEIAKSDKECRGGKKSYWNTSVTTIFGYAVVNQASLLTPLHGGILNSIVLHSPVAGPSLSPLFWSTACPLYSEE